MVQEEPFILLQHQPAAEIAQVGFVLVLGIYPEVWYSGRKPSIGIYL